MKRMIPFARYFVGILFIISGLIKANDPLGLAYKMDEYFAVWNWTWALPYSLYLSVGMNVLEVVSGLALILGWAPKLVTRLLLVLILFFTFLTGYAVLSGKIKTCGCFGDCIPLEAWQSFVKDLILLGFILVLVRYYRLIKPWLTHRAALFLVLFVAGFIFWGQYWVLQHLPRVDCLPYKVGNNLLQQMKPAPGSLPDSVAIIYTYQKNGQRVQFDSDHFPEDFDDSTYQYMDRSEQVIRKGNAQAAIVDFSLVTLSGTDSTQEILGSEQPYLFFVAKDFEPGTPAWQELFAKIYLKARQKNRPLYVLTNQPLKANQFFNESNHFNIPVLTVDGTVLKSFLRSKTGVIAMQGPLVQQKWAEADMNDVIRFLNL